MIKRLFAFLLLLITICLTQTVEVPRPISLTVAELGDSITLQCPVSRERIFYWYKQSVGYLLQTVAEVSLEKIYLLGEFNNSRFIITKEVSQYFLVITNVSKEDEAAYLCQSGSAYDLNFVNGTFLTVNGKVYYQFVVPSIITNFYHHAKILILNFTIKCFCFFTGHSDYDLQKSVYVKQDPETKSVQLGDPVSLQCSLLFRNQENRTECPDKRRVSWFRSGKSHPDLVYTPWNSSADCRASPLSQRSCVYTLPKHIRSSSDAETYYCAVATCGEILFGDGTRVETRSRSNLGPVDLVLGILLACCVVIISVLCYFVKQRRVCEHCKGATSASIHLTHGKSAVDRSSAAETEEEALNYAALNFSTRQVQKGRRTRESQQESVYSDVKSHPTTLHRPFV
ncbi:uncharacterized protein LOC142999422 isoform X1 [Genypterus blacodes]|uniref:uncharacterized protein LOC142999422 isoform X1 n=1 Tax=Genypterus blacodes TaxID=154954 RepID=UPI003F765F90